MKQDYEAGFRAGMELAEEERRAAEKKNNMNAPETPHSGGSGSVALGTDAPETPHSGGSGSTPLESEGFAGAGRACDTSQGAALQSLIEPSAVGCKPTGKPSGLPPRRDCCKSSAPAGRACALRSSATAITEQLSACEDRVERAGYNMRNLSGLVALAIDSQLLEEDERNAFAYIYQALQEVVDVLDETVAMLLKTRTEAAS